LELAICFIWKKTGIASSALRDRFSISLASLQHRPSHAKVRWTSVLLEGPDLQPVQIAQRLSTFGLQSGLCAAVKQLLVPNQREEGAEVVAADGGVGGMPRRAEARKILLSFMKFQVEL
jgi:hypothetical protein